MYARGDGPDRPPAVRAKKSVHSGGAPDICQASDSLDDDGLSQGETVRSVHPAPSAWLWLSR